MKNSDTLIEMMKEQNLRPIPKWLFTLKKVMIWLVISASVILGGLAFSVILFSVQQLDFNLVNHMAHTRIEFLLGVLPFLWIVLLITFLILAMISIKNSSKGYKFSLGSLFGINTALSILLGTLFFIGGGARWLENTFAVNVSAYESIKEKKEKMWSMPEQGYLSGTIVKITDNTIFLTDFNGKNWNIDYKNANVPDVVKLENGESLKLIGKLKTPSHFVAEEIRPWGGGGKFRRDNK